MASSNGALVERAQAVFGDLVFFACLDISSAAVCGLAKRFAGVQGIVADARKIPLVADSCDIVVSQFGIE